MGSRNFVETIKENLGIRAKGGKIKEIYGIVQLREEEGTYIVNSDGKKDDIGAENGYLWNINP